jgi:hypothetical protein
LSIRFNAHGCAPSIFAQEMPRPAMVATRAAPVATAARACRADGEQINPAALAPGDWRSVTAKGGSTRRTFIDAVRLAESPDTT